MLVLLGVLDRRLAIVEAVGEELRVLPRRDDLQRRIERHVGQLEADLVVALAGGAVADGVGAGLVRDQHLVLGDQRPRDGGAEQVVRLVDRVRPQHREAVVLGELLAQVLDDDLVGAALVGLLLDALELVALAELGGERDELHAGVAVLEPREDDGGIQPAGVGEHDLLRSGHARGASMMNDKSSGGAACAGGTHHSNRGPAVRRAFSRRAARSREPGVPEAWSRRGRRTATRRCRCWRHLARPPASRRGSDTRATHRRPHGAPAASRIDRCASKTHEGNVGSRRRCGSPTKSLRSSRRPVDVCGNCASRHSTARWRGWTASTSSRYSSVRKAAPARSGIGTDQAVPPERRAHACVDVDAATVQRVGLLRGQEEQRAARSRWDRSRHRAGRDHDHAVRVGAGAALLPASRVPVLPVDGQPDVARVESHGDVRGQRRGANRSGDGRGPARAGGRQGPAARHPEVGREPKATFHQGRQRAGRRHETGCRHGQSRGPRPRAPARRRVPACRAGCDSR